ncbi:DUF4252 domain-containing protein [Flavobacterium suzhouense]|uniref:DUF4252 domain-containing protein n=1 Tax=Flavobacterium suzhouense TaxID=1529638 RepID=A0ABW5NXH6_9FLAO
MKRYFYISVLMMLVLASCDQKPTLQKYFVKKSEEKNFSTIDIGKSIIKTDKLKLSEDEQKALESVDKLNVLIFKSTDNNAKTYDAEKANIKNVLKEDHYDELMKMSLGGGGISVNTKGEGEHIEEFVVFLHNKDTGMGVLRVLGDDMTPNNVMTIVGILQKGGIDSGKLKPFMDIMKKK